MHIPKCYSTFLQWVFLLAVSTSKPKHILRLFSLQNVFLESFHQFDGSWMPGGVISEPHIFFKSQKHNNRRAGQETLLQSPFKGLSCALQANTVLLSILAVMGCVTLNKLLTLSEFQLPHLDRQYYQIYKGTGRVSEKPPEKCLIHGKLSIKVGSWYDVLQLEIQS